MRKLIITCLCAMAAMQSQAQSTSGKISYKETIQFKIDLKGAEVQGISADQLAALLPKENVSKKVLYYTADAALYDNDKATENTDATTASNGMHIMMKMDGNDTRVYQDLKAGKTITEQEFMSRKFLITNDVKKEAWKLTGKQKEILGYPCQQATRQQDSTTITAWFTSAIPVSAGPMGYGGLPGMILSLGDGDHYEIEATKIDPGTIDAKLLAKPKDGKKVTEAEFKKIMTDKMKEMGVEEGGAPHITIKTQIGH